MKTRMVKCQCGDCAYTVRTTRKWLDELGPPLCPCNSEPMEVPDDAAWDQSHWERGQRAALAATDTARGRTLRDEFVYTRTDHRCEGCRGEIQSGDYARHHTYSLAGELRSEYRHFDCSGLDSFGAEVEPDWEALHRG